MSFSIKARLWSSGRTGPLDIEGADWGPWKPLHPRSCGSTAGLTWARPSSTEHPLGGIYPGALANCCVLQTSFKHLPCVPSRYGCEHQNFQPTPGRVGGGLPRVRRTRVVSSNDKLPLCGDKKSCITVHTHRTEICGHTQARGSDGRVAAGDRHPGKLARIGLGERS